MSVEGAGFRVEFRVQRGELRRRMAAVGGLRFRVEGLVGGRGSGLRVQLWVAFSWRLQFRV